MGPRALLSAAVLALPWPGAAEAGDVFAPRAWPDASEFPGNPLDLREVSFGQRATELWLTVRTYGALSEGLEPDHDVCVKLIGDGAVCLHAGRPGRVVVSAPMVDEVTAALDGLTRRVHFTAAEDLVFPNDVGEHLCGWTLRRRYYAALEAAGLPRLRFHDLRHCFATIAVQRLPLHTVQGYLGHAHISTTMRYVHHTPAARDVALLSEAIRAETVLISGHARDTLAAVCPSQTVADDAVEPIREEAPTGIEPVYTALQAAA